MSTKRLVARLDGGMRFVVQTGSGHQVVADSGEGDTGPRPTELVLVGLAACTGMDVITILRKKRQMIESYEVEVMGPRVKVIYSLTSMGCPAGPLIEQDIERVVQEIPEVEAVETELTFDPPWTPDKMSDDAKFILGIG